MALLHEGDYLGELSILDNSVSSEDVICLENTTCSLLTRDSFTKLLKKHPEIALQMAKALVARIQVTDQRVAPASRHTPAPTPYSKGPEFQRVQDGAAPVCANRAAGKCLSSITSSISSAISNVYSLDVYSSAKHRTKDFLMDMFSTLYFMKMMTRFSSAIVACPVEVRAEKQCSEVLESSIDGVKLTIFPSTDDQILEINAYGNGEFSAAVFSPDPGGNVAGRAFCYLAGKVFQDERLRLHIPAREPFWLEAVERGDRQISCAQIGGDPSNLSRWNVPSRSAYAKDEP